MFRVPNSFIIDEKVLFEIDDYMYIQNNIRNTNVSTDESFKKKYCKYYNLNANTKPEFQKEYFEYMENIKENKPLPTYSQILTDLYNKTKRIDYSFCSKLLHTLDCNKPILDRHIMRFLGFEVRDSGKWEKRISYYSEVYETVCDEYSKISLNLKNGSNSAICTAIRSFDRIFPEYSEISTTRKIDLILFRMKKGRGNSILNI